ncbi:MAG TPA: hypothetical protein VF715_16305 [Thermoleophilaceae bacterium]|jgi:hypothetical protein
MPRLRHTILLLVALICALAAPAPALADKDSDAVIEDCYTDGKVDGNYDRDDLKNARDDLPSDIDEYSDCRSAINSALDRGGRGKRGGSGGVPGGGFRGGGTAGGDPALSTDSGAIAGSREDLDALAAITDRSDDAGAQPRIPVGTEPIVPAAGAASVGDSNNDMPEPLLAALIAVAALGALGGAFAAWRRRPQLLRRGPLRFGRG